MNAETFLQVCSNPDCKFAESGRCVDGNPIEECPFISTGESRVDVPVEQPTTDTFDTKDTPSVKEQPVVNIGGLECMTVTETSEFLKSQPAPIIAFLGAAESGKTSLIGEVFDAFQYASYKDISFAGSKTLTAFERICHPSRAESRASALRQERTEMLDDPFFYHIRISSDKNDGLIDLLLADRSGETYKSIADTPSLGMMCIELRRASTLNVLVDGARLCNPAQRATVLTECRQALFALATTGTTREGLRVNLVLTKLDLVDDSDHKARAHEDFDQLDGLIRERCGSTFHSISLFKIAARPSNAIHPKGHGVEPLIKSWKHNIITSTKFSAPSIEPHRAMGRTQAPEV